MGDRYLPPPPPRREDRSRYARDHDYDPYARYDRDERYDRERNQRYARDEHYDGRAEYGRDARFERLRSPPPRSPSRQRREPYSSQDAGYTFRGAASRDDDRAPPDRFSFRAPGPRFPSPDRYAPPFASRDPPLRRRGDNARRGAQRRGRGQYNGPPRRRYAPPSERDILHKSGRSTTPEQLEGMNPDGQVRFNALASSSEESGDEHNGRPTSSSEEEGEIRRKRFKVNAPSMAKPDVPQWSNPDPYSVLPPTENTGGPKKDIVQVIRKAKNDMAPRPDMTQAAAKNADFISFTFDDDVDNDKASTRRRDATEDQATGLSSPLSSTLSEFSASNLGWSRYDDRVDPIPLKRKNQSDASQSPRPSVIDLTGDGDSPPSKRPKRMPSAGLAAGGRRSPPPPPPGFVMPTDEELMQQYIGQPKGKKRKYDEQSKARGAITEAWEADWTDPTPWCTVDRSQTANVDQRLHEEIMDFFDFVRPHQYEEAMRQDLIRRAQEAVRGFGHDAKTTEIKCFGSFAAGLYLPTADMDLVAVSPTYMRSGQRVFCRSPTKLYKLVAHLDRNGIVQPGSCSAVPYAKVPIVKFVDGKTRIKVDISFENDSGLRANRIFQDWKIQFPVMPVIVVLIKQMLAMRDLNEVFTGGLGGFSIICLVVSMIQNMSEDEYESMVDVPDYGKLLLKFLDLYGNDFDTRSTGIIMNPPGYYDKIRNPMKTQNANNLTIIDPNNPNNDISGGSREVHVVFEVFRKAHAQIMQRMSKIEAGKDVRGSILGCVLGGNYTSFIRQRNKLYDLHVGGDASAPPPEPVGSVLPRPQKRNRPNHVDNGQSSDRLRGKDSNKTAPPGGSLATRIQGGPPAQPRDNPSKPSTEHPPQLTKKEQKKTQSKKNRGAGRREKNKNLLKAIHRDLPARVGTGLSIAEAEKMGRTREQRAQAQKMGVNITKKDPSTKSKPSKKTKKT